MLGKCKWEQEHELAEMKSDFFTNISHELRTPLTLISAPVSEIKHGKVSSARLNELLDLVFVNTDKLMRLINQLLDFSKLERVDVTLNPSRTDVVHILKTICRSFEPVARQKHILLSFSSEYLEYWGVLDADVVDKVVSNLVFNAIKYTPEHGKVDVSFEIRRLEQGLFFHIEVTDTGVGIAPDNLDKIFEKYYREKQGQGYGYGIGLSVVKSLVLFHFGTIRVKSEWGKGTVFIVEIPAYEGIYEKNRIKIIKSQGAYTLRSERMSNNQVPLKRNDQKHTIKEVKSKDGRQEKNVILVAEDNDDLRSYLCHILSDEYNVLQASNGKEALQLAIEHIPNLIVSDVMMPEMDGMALSVAIKSDIYTHHIPFVFLTAKSGVESQNSGFEAGAEDYITKPFDIYILRKKIHNLLRLVEANCEQLRRQFIFEPREVLDISNEDDFIRRLTQKIRENISVPNFNVEMLSGKMAISSRQLYRKLKQKNTSLAELMKAVEMEHSKTVFPPFSASMSRVGNDSFIQYATKVVYENISDPSFDVAQFSSAMAISYKQLQRKFKATIGMSATEFIRTIRMKHAAELLKSGKHRVAEVMFEVGFENPSYFTRTFKQHFGKTPKDM